MQSFEALLSQTLTYVFAVLLVPFGLLFYTAHFLKLPVDDWFSGLFSRIMWWSEIDKADVLDVLHTYGLTLDHTHLLFHDTVTVSPDKLYYFFTQPDKRDTVLVLLIEDYIPSLSYVKSCFTSELQANLHELHKPLKQVFAEEDFQETEITKKAAAYETPADWNKLKMYMVPFPPYYSAFLATITPKHSTLFWKNAQRLRMNRHEFYRESYPGDKPSR